MKRTTLFASTAATLLSVALLPAVASAKSHHRHHHRSARTHLRFLGTSSLTAPASDNAGTVTSFVGGVLTIKLTDGSSVTGKVTAATELKCETAPVSTTARMADHGGGDGGGSGAGSFSGNDGSGGPESDEGPSQSGPAPVAGSSDDNGQDANDENGQDANDIDESQPPVAGQPAEGEENHGEACEMSSLKEGTAVRDAELALNSTGASFRELEIIV